jgi:hypothetical protein
MTKVIFKSRVGSDGVLRLSVPLGAVEMGREVTVTIENASADSFDRQTWQEFLASIEGKWQGEFERPPQLEAEQREAFP